MKNSDLFNSISGIDQKFVDEAYGQATIIKQSTITWRKIANAAACLVIVAVIGGGIFYANFRNSNIDSMTEGRGGVINPENMLNQRSAGTLQHCRFSQDGWDFSLILPENWQLFDCSQVEENKLEIGWVYDGDHDKIGYNNLAFSFSEGVYHETSNNGNGGSEGYTEPVGDVFMEIRPSNEYSDMEEFYDVVCQGNVSNDDGNNRFSRGSAFSAAFGEEVYWVSSRRFDDYEKAPNLMIYSPSRKLHIYIPDIYSPNVTGVILQFIDKESAVQIYDPLLQETAASITGEYNILEGDIYNNLLPLGKMSENMDNKDIKDICGRVSNLFRADGIEWDLTIGQLSEEEDIAAEHPLNGKYIMSADIKFTVDFIAEYAANNSENWVVGEFDNLTFKYPNMFTTEITDDMFKATATDAVGADYEKEVANFINSITFTRGDTAFTSAEDFMNAYGADITEEKTPITQIINGKTFYGFSYIWKGDRVFNGGRTIYNFTFTANNGQNYILTVYDDHVNNFFEPFMNSISDKVSEEFYEYYSPTLDTTYKIPVGYEVRGFENGFNVLLKEDFEKYGNEGLRASLIKYGSNNPANFEEYKASIEAGFTKGQPLDENGNAKFKFDFKQYGSFYEAIITYNFEDTVYYKGYDSATGITVDCSMADEPTFQQILKLNGWGQYANTDGTYDYYSPSLDATYKIPVGYEPVESNESPYIGFSINMKGNTNWGGTYEVVPTFTKYYLSDNPPTSLEEFKAIVEEGFTSGQTLDGNGNPINTKYDFETNQYGSFYEVIETNNITSERWYKGYDTATGVLIDCPMADNEVFQKILELNGWGQYADTTYGSKRETFQNIEFEYPENLESQTLENAFILIGKDEQGNSWNMFTISRNDVKYTSSEDFIKTWESDSANPKATAITKTYNGINFYGYWYESVKSKSYNFTFTDKNGQNYFLTFYDYNQDVLQSAECILNSIKEK